MSIKCDEKKEFNLCDLEAGTCCLLFVGILTTFFRFVVFSLKILELGGGCKTNGRRPLGYSGYPGGQIR